MRTFLLLLCCVLLATSACAQSLPPTRTEPAFVLVDGDLVGGLVLDTVQRRQLGEVERQYQRSYDTILSIDTLNAAELRVRLQDLNDRREAEIKGVMSAEQYAQWQLIVAAQKQSTSE